MERGFERCHTKECASQHRAKSNVECPGACEQVTHCPQLKPELALVLVHDLLLAKKGIAAPKNHDLVVAVTKNKTRLSGEFTKCRIRRGFATFEAWKESIDASVKADLKSESGNGSDAMTRPRWIRINSLRISLEDALSSIFKDYEKVDDVSKLVPHQSKVYVDEHVPNLVAVPHTVELTKHDAYRSGKLIFQDKASCFPAYLLDPTGEDRHIIDACAAPGNKTTHLAAIASQLNGKPKIKITACERSAIRAETLTKMVNRAGASDMITVLAKQDFLDLDPEASQYADVTALLLDPSCSGSGIVGRDDENEVDGQAQRALTLPTKQEPQRSHKRGKKRKMAAVNDTTASEALKNKAKPSVVEPETPSSATDDGSVSEELEKRLQNLAGFQLKLLKHAFRFPAARKITYSTCSIHAAENEHVAIRAVQSAEARRLGWRLMLKQEQPSGMQDWPVRGVEEDALEPLLGGHGLLSKGERDCSLADASDAMIRCEKGTALGTMGFFVAGFVRDRAGPVAGS